MTDEQQKAIDVLRSDNHKLASLVKDAVNHAVVKSSEMILSADSAKDLKSAIDSLETAAKIVGLSPKESQTTIQINAINGFDFIEMDEAEVFQLELQESFEEAEYDEAE